MNERALERLSGENKVVEVVDKTIWNGDVAETKELRLFEGDNPRSYYYVYLRGEASYLISESKFERMMTEIQDGAKFVRINDDLINVNEIRRCKKNK